MRRTTWISRERGHSPDRIASCCQDRPGDWVEEHFPTQTLHSFHQGLDRKRFGGFVAEVQFDDQQNHDLQVRFRWRKPNDTGEWCFLCMPRYCLLADRLRPSRATVVCSTPPRLIRYEGSGDRIGFRAVGVVERPYVDAAGKV